MPTEVDVLTLTTLSDISQLAGKAITISDKVTGEPALFNGNSLIAVEFNTNKSTNIITDALSDIKYPSVKAIKEYADGLVAGMLDYRGGYNASGNVYPSTGGSGLSGAVVKGDMWVISVAGTLGGKAVQVGDSIIANADSPGQTEANWNTFNANISYVPEDIANKVTSISSGSTNIQYPSAKLLYDQLALKANLAGGNNFSGNQKIIVPSNGTQSLKFGTVGTDYHIITYDDATGFLTFTSDSGNRNINFMNGKVGIGTTTPSYLLDVADGYLKLGYLYAQGSSSNPTLGTGSSDGSIFVKGGATYEGGGIKMFGGAHPTTPGIITFSVGTQSGVSPEVMRISNGGYVGIGYSRGTEIENYKLAVNGGGYFNGRITFAPITNPSVEGSLWNDSTQKCLCGYIGGLLQYDVRNVFEQTATTTIENTTTETSGFSTGIGTLTFPANFFIAGKKVKIKMSGYLSGLNGTESTVRVKLGETTLIASTASLPTAMSNVYFDLTFDFKCIASGSSGTFIGEGRTLLAAGVAITTSYVRGLVMTSNATINTTTSNAINVTYQWTTASASNSLKIILANVEVLN